MYILQYAVGSTPVYVPYWYADCWYVPYWYAS